ncbi:MAG: protein kinase [Deltaproteobacteria bacterium]|nr:protein kinase [Deltaproteobacteria bacterium]
MTKSDDPPKPARTLIGQPIRFEDLPPKEGAPPRQEPAEAPKLPGVAPLAAAIDQTIPMGSNASALRAELRAALAAGPAVMAARVAEQRGQTPPGGSSTDAANPGATAPMGSRAIAHAAAQPNLAATTVGTPPSAEMIAAAMARQPERGAEIASNLANLGTPAAQQAYDARFSPPSEFIAPAQPPAIAPGTVPADSMFARQRPPTSPNPAVDEYGRAKPPTGPNPIAQPYGSNPAPPYAHGSNLAPPYAHGSNLVPGVDPTARTRPPTQPNADSGNDPSARSRPPTGPNPAAAGSDPSARSRPPTGPSPAGAIDSADPNRVRPPTGPNPQVPHDPTMYTQPTPGPFPGSFMAPQPTTPMAPNDATMMAAPQLAVSDGRPRASTDAMRPQSSDLLREIPIDNYEVTEEIARGGMGRILRARDVRLHRPVAIKELLGNNAMFKARFEREALITARLQHPSIVPIYEAGRWPTGELFYTMKLVSGRPLEQIIESVFSMQQRLALLPNMIAVAEALAYAHSHNIVHRDLKPANILVGDFGETIVIDWGLAKDLTTNEVAEPAGPFRTPAIGAVGATVAGSIMGTPAYMPVEQGRGLQVDARADVYAIGAVLYHVLGRRAPYDGPDGMSILQEMLKAPPPPLTEIAPDVPRELATIVAKAMARAPDQRYPTASGLVEDLRAFQNGKMVGTHRYSAGELFRRWAKKHKGALATAVVAFVVLAVVGVLAISRVVSANREAQVERDAAVEQHKAALAAAARAEDSEGRAKRSERMVSIERDRQRFARERRVEFDHFKHTERRKCADCHIIDPATFTAKLGSPGHAECSGQCHDPKLMAGLSNDPKCAFCHIDRVATTKDHASLRACDDGSVAAIRSAGGKTAPCFRHDRKDHRLDAAGKALECTNCHAVVGDKTKWGTKKYASLQDLDTNTIIGQGPGGGIDAMHKACTTGCHAHEGQTGQGAGETKCNMCHPARDMSEL